MLNKLKLEFHPKLLSNKELMSQITKLTPQILLLPEEEQKMVWKFIGTSLQPEQQELVTFILVSLLKKRTKDYAQGIRLNNNDIVQLNESIQILKNIDQS